MESMEEEMLLKRSINEKDGDQNLGSKLSWSQYICLNVVIVLFSVAQVVEYNVIPLYMYAYFEENGGDKNTDNETYVNNTANASETNECGFNSSNSEDMVQTLTTQWLWYLDLTHYGCLFFNIVTTGALSDVIGRKPFILLPLFGSVLRYFIKAILFYTNGDIHYLFIPYAISGLTGTPSSFQIAVLALISDSTSGGKSRSVYLAIYDLMLGIGEGSALAGSGYLIQDVGYVIPPIISSVICLLCGLVVIFTVKETLKPKNERISVGESCKNLLGFYHNKSYIREQFPLWMFKLTILTYLVYVFPQSGGLDSIYEMGSPFCWSAEDIGWFESASLMITLIIGVCMMKILQIPFNDEVIGVLCFLSACGYRILFFLAKSTWMLYLASIAGILRYAALPIVRGILSRLIVKEHYGAMFANLAVIDAVIGMSGDTVFNNIYTKTVGSNRGLVFLIMAVFYLLCCFLFTPLIYTKSKSGEMKVDNKYSQ